MAKISGNLWRTIYDIQGEAQQAMGAGRDCRSIEETWRRLKKVLPMPYAAAPELLEALTATRAHLADCSLAMAPGQTCDNQAANICTPCLARAAIAKARGE